MGAMTVGGYAWIAMVVKNLVDLRRERDARRVDWRASADCGSAPGNDSVTASVKEMKVLLYHDKIQCIPTISCRLSLL